MQTFKEFLKEDEAKQLEMNLGRGFGKHKKLYHMHYSHPEYSPAHNAHGHQHYSMSSTSLDALYREANKHGKPITIHKLTTGKVKRGGAGDTPEVHYHSGEFEPSDK